MSRWLIVAPEHPDDAALQRSAWVARVTAEASPLPPRVVAGGQVSRQAVEQALDPATPGLGFAFFGHGRSDRLCGAVDEAPPLLDQDNVGQLRGGWIHAFACNSGRELGPAAVARGVSIYVGYQSALEAAWSVPPDAEPAVVRLVTAVTLALLDGERDERALRRRVSDAADELYLVLRELSFEEHPGLMWLYHLAEQLTDDLVAHVSAS